MKKIVLAGALLSVMLFAVCSKKTWDNPIGSDYTGSYSFSLDTTHLDDTLEVFTVYHLPFTCTGSDSFFAMGIGLDWGGYVDTTVFADSQTDTSVALYFVKSLTDTVEIDGVRPNRKRVSAPLFVNVVNPYNIETELIVASGETCVARIERTRAGTSATLSVAWSVDGGAVDTIGIAEQYSFAAGSSGSRVVRAELVDTYGSGLVLDNVTVTVAGTRPVAPQVMLPPQVWLGDTLTLGVSSSEFDSSVVPVWIVVGSDTILDGAYFPRVATSVTVIAASPVRVRDSQAVQVWYATKNGFLSSAFIDTVVVGYVEPFADLGGDSMDVPSGEPWVFRVQDTTGTAMKYEWNSSVHGAVASATTADSLVVTYPLAITDTIAVRGIDMFGFQGPWDTLIVRAMAMKYVLKVTSTAADSVLARHWAQMSAAVTRSGVAVNTGVVYHWSHGAAVDSADANGATLRLYRDSSGTAQCSVYAVIDGSDSTILVTQSLQFRPHRPSVNLTSPSATVSINTTVSCTAHVADNNPGGSVLSVYWQLGDALAQSGDTVWALSFETPGSHWLKSWCVDNDGFVSDTDSVLIVVVSGAPVITDVLYTDPVYMNKAVMLTIDTVVSLNGGTIDEYYWDFNQDTSSGWDSTTTDRSLSYTFTSAGTKMIWVQCRDEFDSLSTVQAFSITVEPGNPVLDSIYIDTASTQIFVGDTRNFRIGATDPNGTIAALYFEVDGSQQGSNVFATATAADTFSYTFATNEAGSHTVSVIAVDNDSLRDTSSLVVTVRLGAPVIDSVSHGTIWVRDQTWYRIFARDTNGTVDSFRMSFDNGTTWLAADSSRFSHAWDTAQSGLQPVICKAMDNDSVWSADTFEVAVRLGRPVLSGADFGDSIQWVEGVGGGLDTMFYVYKGGKTYMAVDSADTNGYVTEFYWDVGDNGLDETSTAPTISAIGWDANEAKYLKVWCKDDDGILSEPLYCWVYPDSVPEIPLQISEAKVGTDSVKLTWSGNDVKDGDALQFQILCDKSNPPTTEVKSFGICEKSGNDFFTVIPIASNGRYYWKVTARDARESETTSLSVRVFDFPLP